MRKSPQNNKALFERIMLPHLESAFNLARWLIPNRNDAEDVVQDAYLKAFRLFDSYADQNSRAWMLTIVRNTSYTWLKQNNKVLQNNREYEEQNYAPDHLEVSHNAAYMDPCEWQVIQADIQGLYRAIDLLPFYFREVIILREIEGCSYKELSDILEVPAGTVMSRVSRARQMLLRILKKEAIKEQSSEL